MRTKPAYIIGVDGGGSGCRAAIARIDGPILGEGSAGPANATTDMAQAVANVQSAISDAADAAGLDDAALGHAVAHVGLAGILTAQDARQVARDLQISDVTVTDDRPTFVKGALGPRDGILFAIGTGSFAALSRRGRKRFAGGWGFQLSDQASGAWLGRALLERVLLAHDGVAEQTELTCAVLSEYGDAEQIVTFVQTARAPDYAQYAPRIAEAAEAGDTAAADLMRGGADYLNRVLDAFGLEPQDVICLAGGFGPRYRNWLTEPVRGRVVEAAGNALDGALELARATARERVGQA